MNFWTDNGVAVPTVTAEGMRAVDRIAMEDFGLGILQMMENAGRNLAGNVLDMLGGVGCRVTVLAGGGGNGGGGLCCARHLHNRAVPVQVVLDRDPGSLTGAARVQWEILQAAGLELVADTEVDRAIREAKIVVDALVGYSLRGAPRGRAAELIDLTRRHAERVLSLDIPSGVDATTGATPGISVRPERTLTLALPKSGLQNGPGELFLADIGIPPEVYHRLGLVYKPPFQGAYWIRLTSALRRK